METIKRLRGKRSREIQVNALQAALCVVEQRIAVCQKAELDWAAKHPEDHLGLATERAARQEAEVIAEGIRALLPPHQGAGNALQT
jgi:hypothetical protein